MNRFDGRKTDELRPVKIIKDFTREAEAIRRCFATLL